MKLRLSLLLAVAFILVVGMSSCVRSYVCQCDIKYSGAPGLPPDTTKEYDVKDTKKEAKKKCEDNSGTFDNDGIHTDETCHLY